MRYERVKKKLEDAVKNIEAAAKIIGLEMNKEKTVYTVVNKKGGANRETFTLNGMNYEKVKEGRDCCHKKKQNG